MSFGWFGVPPEIVHNQFLNVLGLMLCIVGQLLMLFVEPPADTKVKVGTDDEEEYDSKPLTKDGSKLTINTDDVPDSKSSEMTPLIMPDSSCKKNCGERNLYLIFVNTYSDEPLHYILSGDVPKQY